MKRLIWGLLVLLMGVGGGIRAEGAGLAFAERGGAIGTREFTIEDEANNRTIPVTLWYPAAFVEGVEMVTYRDGIISLVGTAQDSVPVSAAQENYPLVIFSHGSGGFRFQSLWLTEHLASQGFMVMAANHTLNTVTDAVLDNDVFSESIGLSYAYRPLDVLAQISLADELNASDALLAGRIDTDNIAVMGHSFGGYTAIAVGGGRLNFQQLGDYCATEAPPQNNVCFVLEAREGIADVMDVDADTVGAWPGIRDERVKAVVALAPWNAPIFDAETLGMSDIPHLFLVGEADPTTPPERDAYHFYAGLNSARRALGTFAGGGHYLFVDECFPLAIQAGFTAQCTDAVWELPDAHNISNYIITAFLLDVLLGDAEARDALENIQFEGVTFDIDEPQGATAPAQLVPNVLERYPHDTSAFTQGLLLFNGEFYESTGLYGRSSLRRVDVTSGEVLQQVSVPAEYFAEGLALVDDRLIQLTWRENVAIVYDRETFDVAGTLEYDGEGWGLCYDGERLYMTDGSATLAERDAETFEIIRTVTVTRDTMPVTQLNELACVGDVVYANVWMTNEIVEIRKDDGIVTAVINAAGLLTPEEAARADVLNGIAYDETSGLFYITGKNWPYMFLVEFVEHGA